MSNPTILDLDQDLDGIYNELSDIITDLSAPDNRVGEVEKLLINMTAHISHYPDDQKRQTLKSFFEPVRVNPSIRHALLFLAIEQNKLGVASLLIQYGANVDIEDEDGTPLLYTMIRQNNILGIELLSQYKADINHIINHNIEEMIFIGLTPILFAAINKHWNAFINLANLGARLDNDITINQIKSKAWQLAEEELTKSQEEGFINDNMRQKIETIINNAKTVATQAASISTQASNPTNITPTILVPNSSTQINNTTNTIQTTPAPNSKLSYYAKNTCIALASLVLGVAAIYVLGRFFAPKATAQITHNIANACAKILPGFNSKSLNQAKDFSHVGNIFNSKSVTIAR
ncbi:ankyrin repeat domain-containing protein [Rickettsiales endosymbiont of Stachyamoeba lipophora]|uniref:ankyrin repeat domain-containing protein n=1 Tax=Rickettsiales endosymbiont of Stachyamoeba lipophora TaxID=2486578 RepID=UPI000F64CC96|nr:ankyrin repeat domain-containing protein [Rickettsiales endosymbiont of Stachyamoeba lipophora]AZL15315.1 ankyrin repeat domain-containing protein [Rickettsiales endosymbiont of Stachyamoeba lipophora]